MEKDWASLRLWKMMKKLEEIKVFIQSFSFCIYFDIIYYNIIILWKIFLYSQSFNIYVVLFIYVSLYSMNLKPNWDF